jgi:hypothetical protein
VNANVAKAVEEEGGIEILASLARSMNKLVAEEAAGRLWNLSVGEEHKVRFCCIGYYFSFQNLLCKVWSKSLSGFHHRVPLLKLVECKH